MSKIIKLNGIRKRTMLCRIKEPRGLMAVMMCSITKEQEEELDEKQSIVINNTTVDIDRIYCYGQIDINNEEDRRYIERFNLVDQDTGGIIYSDYDYETGIAPVIDNKTMIYSTFKPIKWFKYNHLLIGKPERIIVFKCFSHEL